MTRGMNNSIHESGRDDPKKEAMTENDECPNCKSGTLEKNGNDLVCRGECGATFPDALAGPPVCGGAHTPDAP